MNTRYTPTSRTTRLLAAASATVVTATLFVAVATGLTGEDASSLLTAAPSAPVHAVRAA